MEKKPLTAETRREEPGRVREGDTRKNLAQRLTIGPQSPLDVASQASTTLFLKSTFLT